MQGSGFRGCRLEGLGGVAVRVDGVACIGFRVCSV